MLQAKRISQNNISTTMNYICDRNNEFYHAVMSPSWRKDKGYDNYHKGALEGGKDQIT